jgi:hypothetical protein
MALRTTGADDFSCLISWLLFRVFVFSAYDDNDHDLLPGGAL